MMRGCYLLALLVFLVFGSIKAGKKTPLPPRFSVGVDVVTVRVTVTDPLNRYVIGLGKEHFRIFENKIEQTITHFSNEDSPVSVGVIMDVSGSMRDNILSARTSVVRFLERGNTDDEYFLITFNERSSLIQDFTPRSENVRNVMAFTNTKGRTALFDGMYLGLQKIREAQNEKKALIVITDGEDNSSRYTFSEVRDFAKESDVQIYVIGERGDLGFGRGIIRELVGLTGGRTFFPNNLRQLDYLCDIIHTELRNQYLVGYTSTDRDYDGRWRKIKVQLKPPEGLPKLSVRSKQGYFSPLK